MSFLAGISYLNILMLFFLIRILKSEKFYKPWSYSIMNKKYSHPVLYSIKAGLSFFSPWLSSQTIYLSEIHSELKLYHQVCDWCYSNSTVRFTSLKGNGLLSN